MNVGKLVNTNSKGQIVIPLDMRQELGIEPGVTLNITRQKTGIFIQPIASVVPVGDTNEAFIQLLEETAGAWGEETTVEKTNREQKEKLEFEASQKRKEAW